MEKFDSLFIDSYIGVILLIFSDKDCGKNIKINNIYILIISVWCEFVCFVYCLRGDLTWCLGYFSGFLRHYLPLLKSSSI